MTAMMTGSEGHADRCTYPERLSIRITQADHHLYDALKDATADTDVTTSHIGIALLRWWESDPDFRAAILADAQEIAVDRSENAKAKRNPAISRTLLARAAKRKNNEDP